MSSPFPKLSGLSEIETPALLFIQERIESNIQRMIEIVGGDPSRLRPHVKSHKTSEIIRLQVDRGITRFKAATLAEAELCAKNGAEDVLLAYPIQGPAIAHLLQLQIDYPETLFSMLVDSPETLPTFERILRSVPSRPALGLLLDLDCGMGRTGIQPGEVAFDLYTKLCQLPQAEVRGIHAYDGHLHDADFQTRKDECRKAFGPVLKFRDALQSAGLKAPTLVAGGSPTFAIHAAETDRECSPGTTLLWDFGYGDRYPDLPFECAAFLLTRIVSKPVEKRLCLDLGHKAVAPEMPHPRIRIQGLEEAPVIMQSEEHLVLEVADADRFSIGDALLGIPRHVCPSVSMHNQAIPFRNGCSEAPWLIAARGRTFTHSPF